MNRIARLMTVAALLGLTACNYEEGNRPNEGSSETIRDSMEKAKKEQGTQDTVGKGKGEY